MMTKTFSDGAHHSTQKNSTMSNRKVADHAGCVWKAGAQVKGAMVPV